MRRGQIAKRPTRSVRRFASRLALRASRGFTLVEVLAALVIMAFVVTAFLTVNSEGLAKTGRARQLSAAVDLARQKLAEIALDALPTREEEGDWAPFTDREGRDIENGYLWRKAVREVPFVPPGGTDPIAGFRAWEVTVTVSPAGDLSPERAVTVTRWLDVPPVQPGGGGPGQ